MQFKADITRDDIQGALCGARSQYAASAINLLSILALAAVTLSAIGGLLTGISASGDALIAAVSGPKEQLIKTTAAQALSLLGYLAPVIFLSLIWLFVFRQRRDVKNGVLKASIVEDVSTGAYTFAIRPQGLVISGPYGRDVMSWRLVVGAEATESACVIRHTNGEFHTIPKRAFPNELSLQATCDTINSYLEAPPLLKTGATISPHSVTYALNANDHSELRDLYEKKKRGALYVLTWLFRNRFLQNTVALVLCLGIVATVSELMTSTGENRWGALAFFALMISIQPATHRFVSALFKLVSKRRDQPYASALVASISLTKAGVIQKSSLSMSFFKWSAVEQLVETRNMLFICLSDYHAIAVPKRAFPDEATFRDFVGKADHLMKLIPPNGVNTSAISAALPKAA